MPTAKKTAARTPRAGQAVQQLAARLAFAPGDAPTPLELHALAVAGKPAEKVRDRLEPIVAAPIALHLFLSGAISVGAEQSFETTSKPSLATLFALLLDQIRDDNLRLLRSLQKIEERYADFLAGGAEPAPTPEAKVVAEDLVARLSRKTVSIRRGSVTGTISAEIHGRG